MVYKEKNLGTNTEATTSWSSGDEPRYKARNKQITESCKSVLARKKTKDKLQEKARGKLKTPTVKIWN
jgi:hypothetical protein